MALPGAPESSAPSPASSARGTSCASSPWLRRSSDGPLAANPPRRQRRGDRWQGARQEGPRDPDRSEEGLPLHRGPQHDQAPPASAFRPGHAEGRRGRRDHRARGPDPHLERDAARLRRQADPRARQARGRRAQARRGPQRQGARLMEATATEQQRQAAPPPRLRELYENEVKPNLTQRFGYSSPMAVPTLDKITLNMGVGEAKQDTKMLEAAIE